MSDGLFEMERATVVSPVKQDGRRRQQTVLSSTPDPGDEMGDLLSRNGVRRYGATTQVCPWCQVRKGASDFPRNPRSGWLLRECIGCKEEREECWRRLETRRVVAGRRYVDDSGGNLICTKCGRSRPRTSFYTFKDANLPTVRYRPKCKQCTHASQMARVRSDAGKRKDREAWLQRKYGIGVDDYDRMFALQDGRCAICGTDEPGGPTSTSSFHVDHSHSTGRVRGLLCRACNTGIGLFHDDLDLMRTALAYIEVAE